MTHKAPEDPVTTWRSIRWLLLVGLLNALTTIWLAINAGSAAVVWAAAIFGAVVIGFAVWFRLRAN